jgi:hypothetical protein
MSDTPESDKNAVEVSVDREFILVPAFCTLEFTRRLERERDAFRTELSKVMPHDFKDWWKNSKDEWPLVARLVIEGRIEREEWASARLDYLEKTLAEKQPQPTADSPYRYTKDAPTEPGYYWNCNSFKSAPSMKCVYASPHSDLPDELYVDHHTHFAESLNVKHVGGWWCRAQDPPERTDIPYE